MDTIATIVSGLVPCLILLSILVFASRKCVPVIPYPESILCFTLGVLASIPLLLWQLFFGHWERSLLPNPFVYALYGACIMAAVPEELSRYLIILWQIRRLSLPVKFMHCLVLGSIVGLGLGTVEHLVYTFSEGWRATWVRLFTAVLIHTMAGAIVGYFVGLSILRRQIVWSILGVTVTITLHTIHNFLIAYLYENPESSSGDLGYWPIRIFIELIYVVLVVILIRKATLIRP